MPTTCCCVPGCHNRGGHKFPSSTLIKKKWIHAVRRGRENGREWTPNASSVVCARHFNDDDYLQQTMYEMLSKGIMQEYKKEMKQFKTATGSPITYAKMRKQRGLYYPMHRPHLLKKKGKMNHNHVAVVYSKMYGREVYENVDIWPDDVEYLKDKNAVMKVYENVGDIPDALEESEPEDDEEEKEEEEVVKEEVSETDSSGHSHSPPAPPTTTDAHPEQPPTAPHDKNHNRKHVTIKITDASDNEDEDGRSSSGDFGEPRPDSPSGSSEHSGTWPAKRSQSIDSRDNPFLPGGCLSKEAEDILARATIIRDKFILTEDEKTGAKPKSVPENRKPETGSPQNGSPKTHAPAQAEAQVPVTETMTTTVAQSTEASSVPKSDSSETRHKENGQLDTENSLTPGSVKVDIMDDPKDRKKQKKCCSVM